MVEKDYEVIVSIRVIANNQKEVRQQIKEVLGGKVADYTITDMQTV